MYELHAAIIDTINETIKTICCYQPAGMQQTIQSQILDCRGNSNVFAGFYRIPPYILQKKMC